MFEQLAYDVFLYNPLLIIQLKLDLWNSINNFIHLPIDMLERYGDKDWNNVSHLI